MPSSEVAGFHSFTSASLDMKKRQHPPVSAVRQPHGSPGKYTAKCSTSYIIGVDTSRDMVEVDEPRGAALRKSSRACAGLVVLGGGNASLAMVIGTSVEDRNVDSVLTIRIPYTYTYPAC